MLKTAISEVDVFRMVQFDSGIGSPEPSLVVELVVVWTVDGGSQFISLDEEHARLQGYVAFLAGAHPGGVAEGDALDGDVAHRVLGITDELYQRFEDGYDG